MADPLVGAQQSLLLVIHSLVEVPMTELLIARSVFLQSFTPIGEHGR